MRISLTAKDPLSYNIFIRLAVMAGSVCYSLISQWTYRNWLSPNYSYLGFTFIRPSPGLQAVAILLSALPALWMPIRIARPSQIIYWVLYLVVYVPSMYIPLYMGLQPPEDIIPLMATMALGLMLTGWSYLVGILHFPQIRLQPLALRWMLALILLLLTLWVVAVFGSNIRLVSFQDVYTALRFKADEIMEGSLVGYAIMWLSGAINPFLMSWGLSFQRYRLFAVGALGQVLLYGVAGSKGILLSVLLIGIIFLVIRRRRSLVGLKLVWGTATLFAALIALNSFVVAGGEQFSMLLSIVFMRIFSIPGYLTGLYHSFFLDHPRTFFSHVKAVNLLVSYPYEKSLGEEIGFYSSGDVSLNANAHLWSSDGLAGMGLPGILLISVICGLVFWIVDSAADGHDSRFGALALTFSAMTISNASLFTSLFSGGLLLSLALLYLAPRRSWPEKHPAVGMLKIG